MNVSKDRDIKITEHSDDLKAVERINKEKYSKINHMEKDYLDFELEISIGTGREYPVITRSPAGEARETMHFPFDELALENRLLILENALLRSGVDTRIALSKEEKTVQDFGKDLFNALLTGEIRNRYDIRMEQAIRERKGLRLKLCILPPQLAALPWEFMYEPRQGEYVCLSKSTSVVRYLELPQPIQPLTVDPPLRILGMIANPSNLPQLDIEREKKRVEEALEYLQANRLVELVWLEGQTWRDLEKAMRTSPWHIFHFIGHGGFDCNKDEGLIALSHENNKAHFLGARELGRLLADPRYPLRLVVLNSCEGARGGERDIFSSTASILVRRGIPAVLAMQYEISDRAAVEFARAFYEAIADGLPVDAAVAEARIAVSVALTNTIEWGTPVLYMRSTDGILFNVKSEPKIDIKKGELNNLIFAAQQLYDKEKYVEAIEKWSEVLNLDPENEIAKKGKKKAKDKIKKFCPRCGKENVNRKEFCRECGIRLYRMQE